MVMRRGIYALLMTICVDGHEERHICSLYDHLITLITLNTLNLALTLNKPNDLHDRVDIGDWCEYIQLNNINLIKDRYKLLKQLY